MSDAEAKKYVKLIGRYENKWVALNEKKTKVLAAASTLKDLESQLTGIETPVTVRRVLPKNRGFAAHAGL